MESKIDITKELNPSIVYLVLKILIYPYLYPIIAAKESPIPSDKTPKI
jgi:hypothetical protein